jgi:type II secretory pathway pseudopilin PulG
LELLVAAAVFSVLLMGLLSITTGTTNLTNLASRNIDASTSIRTALDRLGTDLQNAVIDPGASFYLTQNGTNQELQFLSKVDGYDGQRPLAVVTYRIKEDNKDWMIQRAAQGLDLTQPSLPSTLSAPDDADFDKLAQGVFRFRVELLDRQGNSIPGNPVPSRDVAAVAVSLAAIDDRAKKVAPEVDWPATLPETDFGKWADRFRALDFPNVNPEAARGIQFRRKVFTIPENTR